MYRDHDIMSGQAGLLFIAGLEGILDPIQVPPLPLPLSQGAPSPVQCSLGYFQGLDIHSCPDPAQNNMGAVAFTSLC